MNAMTDYGLGLARKIARERDERYAQLRTAEHEADRYRRALRDIERARLSPAYRLRRIAREVLR